MIDTSSDLITSISYDGYGQTDRQTELERKNHLLVEHKRAQGRVVRRVTSQIDVGRRQVCNADVVVVCVRTSKPKHDTRWLMRVPILLSYLAYCAQEKGYSRALLSHLFRSLRLNSTQRSSQVSRKSLLQQNHTTKKTEPYHQTEACHLITVKQLHENNRELLR